MLAEERWQIIIDLLNKNNVMSVTELSKRLNTSEVTIRRDLRELEDAGALRRTHGGAISLQYKSTSFEPQFAQLESANSELKQQICRQAYKLINDNDAIIIDGSSTAVQLCRYFKQQPKKGVMVVTNSARVVFELASCDSVEIVHIGGQVRKNVLSSTGPLADLVLNQIKVDKAFIGINGIDFSENLLTTPNLSEGAIKRTMMKCARETIVLADHTKFGLNYLCKVCNATDIDHIVTDSAVESDVVKRAEELGTNLIVSEKD